MTEFETQCGLNGNEMEVDGKKAKILSYMGEGLYKCYIDGVTRTIQTRTNKIDVGQEGEDGICRRLVQRWRQRKADA